MEEVIRVSDCVSNIGDYDIDIYNAIIIPPNLTNGEIIKLVFGKKVARMIQRFCYLHWKLNWWNKTFLEE